MLRALSLSPCESYSPTLLRTEPAYLASWIRFRFVRWLLNAPLVTTAWGYENTHTAVLGGARQASLDLLNDGQAVPVEYQFPGSGFEIGLPIPIGLQESFPSMKGANTMWTVLGGGATGDVDHESDTAGLGISKSCMVIDLRNLVDAQLAQSEKGDVSRAVMLFGVNAELRATMGRLAVYTRQLVEAAEESVTRRVRYTPGLLRTEWSPLERGVGLDMRAIREDVEHSFSTYGFRSALFITGVDGKYSGMNMSVFIGEVTNSDANDQGGASVAGVLGDLQDLGSLAMQALQDPAGFKDALVSDAVGAVTGGDPLMQEAASLAMSGGNVADVEQSALSSAAAYMPDMPSMAGMPGVGTVLGAASSFMPGMQTVAAVGAAVTSGAGLLGGSADYGRTMFNEEGERISVPGDTSSFMGDNAGALSGGPGGGFTDAFAQKFGGGEFGNQAAGAVLGKVTGQQPVTMAMQDVAEPSALESMVSQGPVVASGPNGDAAVTGVSQDAAGTSIVHLNDGQTATTMPHSDFTSSYSTLATTDPDLV